MEKILFYSFIMMLSFSNMLFAQYTGGSGDGYAMVEVQNLVSISEIDNVNSSFARAFPNPLQQQQQLHIELSSTLTAPNLSIELHNAVGQLVYRQFVEQPSQFWSLPLLLLPQGVYSLALKSPQKECILKIVQL